MLQGHGLLPALCEGNDKIDAPGPLRPIAAGQDEHCAAVQLPLTGHS
jgi:hypothetical protein